MRRRRRRRRKITTTTGRLSRSQQSLGQLGNCRNDPLLSVDRKQAQDDQPCVSVRVDLHLVGVLVASRPHLGQRRAAGVADLEIVRVEVAYVKVVTARLVHVEVVRLRLPTEQQDRRPRPAGDDVPPRLRPAHGPELRPAGPRDLHLGLLPVRLLCGQGAEAFLAPHRLQDDGRLRVPDLHPRLEQRRAVRAAAHEHGLLVALPGVRARQRAAQHVASLHDELRAEPGWLQGHRPALLRGLRAAPGVRGYPREEVVGGAGHVGARVGAARRVPGGRPSLLRSQLGAGKHQLHRGVRRRVAQPHDEHGDPGHARDIHPRSHLAAAAVGLVAVFLGHVPHRARDRELRADVFLASVGLVRNAPRH
mmetsp:Transcript_46492/g.123494  ORF Transcript_46492/g.123494 Transcript_46492/m.123494 type:complete len:363 (+) Transcript_46492:171-1259(+)